VRVLIFHGYLLDGTGSNIYNARLAAALVGLGHDVHLLSQDRHPERQPFVHAVGDWDSGALAVRDLRRAPVEPVSGVELASGVALTSGVLSGRCTVYRPDIGGLLPVYVADRYEGIEARTFARCSERDLARYIDANVAAVGELLDLVRPHVALANHLVMGPVILARALRGEVPYAVKVHGSALEYTVKPQPERFLAPAREGLAGASAVLVGSRHTAASLWAALGDDELVERTRLGPPGVDVALFAPRDPGPAAAGVRALAVRLRAAGAKTQREPQPQRERETQREPEHEHETQREPRPERERESQPEPEPETQPEREPEHETASAFARDVLASAAALDRIDPDRDAVVAYVGKLIVSKGVDLLIAAWPLVLERVAHARLVVVGFGAYRDGLERLCAALGAGELERAREIARAGSALEGYSQPPRPLRHLLAFLDGLDGEERERYLLAARGLEQRVLLTGRLEHEELADLLPACQAAVVPSTFPEAFGMVAAEAAACGAFPISAAHSGLAEVSAVLAHAIPAAAVAWLSFEVDDDAVRALARALVGWLAADPRLRARTRAGLVGAVRERWSWEGVARGVIAAARGELQALAAP
jgi:glycosyltransferase involved in cell wall biosynthesis